MFKSILVTAYRSALKDSASTAINLLGLVTGFVIFTFAFAFAHYERNYDRFFENSADIVVPYVGIAEGSGFAADQIFQTFYGTRLLAKENFSEVLAASHIVTDERPIQLGADFFRRWIRFVNPDFFDIFDLNFIIGGAQDFGSRTDILLLSETEAMGFFGRVDVLGETFTLTDGQILEVTGVYEDLPLNSHFVTRFGDGVRSFGLIADTSVYERLTDSDLDNTWTSISSRVQTYLLLAEGTDRRLLERDMTTLMMDRITERMKGFVDRSLLRDLGDMNLNIWADQGIPGLLIAEAIGLMILIIAIMNAISLNTARMIDRSREIGLRRVMGATRKHLIVQFLGESFATTILALIMAFGALIALLPFVSSLTDREFSLFNMMDTQMIVLLTATTVTVAFLSVSYPIFLLSGLGHNMSLHRTMHMGHSAGWLRKILTSLQFVVVTALVLAVGVVNRQNTYLMEQAPEFETDRIVSIEGLSEQESLDKMDVLIKALERLPAVDMVSRTNLTPFSGETNISTFNTPESGEDPFRMQIIAIDPNYFPLLDIPLLAGRNLEESRGDDFLTLEEFDNPEIIGVNVIINESGYKRLGFSSPGEAIGQLFLKQRGPDQQPQPLTIVGIIPDILLNTPGSELRPSVFSNQEGAHYSLIVRFQSDTMVDLAAIEAVWKEIVPTAPVEVQMLSQARDAAMEGLRQVRAGFLSIAIIAVILAATGLYALAAFLAASRRKEMGIRKVMGARTFQLVQNLMWQFSKPVGLALIIGLPLGTWGMQSYLEFFPDRINVDFTLIIGAGVMTLAIAWVTVIVHAVKTAQTHPANVLRYE